MAEDKWPPPLLIPCDHFIDEHQPDFQLNACVGRQLPTEYATHHYSKGFRMAARRLVEQLIEGKSGEFSVDTAVYPIVFLYRHHFELTLKLLVVAGRAFLKESGDPPFGHSLKALWATAMPIMERCFDDADWSQNAVVTSLLQEFSELDPNGEAARYPQNRNGVKHFGTLWILHVRHFAEVAERLSDYLSKVLFAIEHTHEQQLEWEAEMMSYYGK